MKKQKYTKTNSRKTILSFLPGFRFVCEEHCIWEVLEFQDKQTLICQCVTGVKAGHKRYWDKNDLETLTANR